MNVVVFGSQSRDGDPIEGSLIARGDMLECEGDFNEIACEQAKQIHDFLRGHIGFQVYAVLSCMMAENVTKLN